ncbi:MAG: class I SAM-dependent methyltransferase, partial [Litorilinea sp.]
MSLNQIQNTPASLAELQRSYDALYRGWMGEHENTDQAQRMLDLLEVRAGQRLLDVGCGTGALLHVAAARGLDVLGVDLSPVALTHARARYELDTRLLLGSGEDLPCADAGFDYVVNLGSLEHFLDPALAVQEMARVLKPGGKAALLVPNSHHLRALYNVWKYGDIISDLQEYERFATRGEWERLLAANGLPVISAHKYDTGMARIYRPGR